MSLNPLTTVAAGSELFRRNAWTAPNRSAAITAERLRCNFPCGFARRTKFIILVCGRRSLPVTGGDEQILSQRGRTAFISVFGY